MTTHHHISDDLLIGYAAGSLSEGWSLVVATHLALCPASRHRVELATEIGGVMLESIDTVSVAEDSLERVMTRIASDAPSGPEKDVVDIASGRTPVIPEPLRSYVGGDVDSIAWRRLGRTARHLPIKTQDRATTVRLLNIPGGERVPEHGHGGTELTLVLSGRLLDGDREYARGDVQQVDASVDHHPASAPGEDCVCLAVTDAPLKFRRGVARLAQPFLRI